MRKVFAKGTRRRTKRLPIIAGILTLMLVGVIGFIVWAVTPAQPEPQALNSLRSTQSVRFELKNGWLIFMPEGSQPSTGLILYPGGRVDPRAYAPLAQAIANDGYAVIIVAMPLNLAVFGVNRAASVIQAKPEIQRWAVGGHSLGGAMAAEFAAANPTQVDGLVLWASYPALSNDLSEASMAVTSIYASHDGLASLEDIESSRERLPERTAFVEIRGGNHSGFGWYGPQNGDGEPQISKSDQQAQIVAFTLVLLSTLGK